MKSALLGNEIIISEKPSKRSKEDTDFTMKAKINENVVDIASIKNANFCDVSL